MSAPVDVTGGPSFSLAGRVVLVTGAGRGLGRGMALAAAGAGATVVGISRSDAELAEAGDQVAILGAGRFVAFPFDVRQGGAFHGLVEQVEAAAGPIDGVVHAAGVQLRKPATDVSVAEWRDVLQVDLEVPFFLSTAIGRRQLAGGRLGSHVFITSLTSSIGAPNVSPYSASKAGLLGVMRSLAVEWATAGIRSNALSPGYYATALTHDVLSVGERRQAILSRIPMGRLGHPDDLGGAIVFLLSDASAYVTGQMLNVDGGWTGS